MTVSLEHVVVIGASLAGLRTAEALRREGFEGRVTLVGREPHLPYSRPPLTKQILSGDWEPERAHLRPKDKLDDLQLDLRLSVRADRLETRSRTVHLDDGTVLSYDAVVLATGAAPRRLQDTRDLAGVHTVRTLDDAIAVRDEFARGPRVVVVGAGFIGAEVAAVARRRGLEVSVLEGLAAPLVRGLGVRLGEVAGQLHRDHGVDLRCGVQVAGLEGHGRVEAVVLSDGSRIPADLVVVGIGVEPVTGWLEGSGVTVRDGVVCDQFLAAVGVQHVWAAGDVARWKHLRYGEDVRLEHWTVAADHGLAVARNLLAGAHAAPHVPVPYVWSDQYDTKIQIVGRGRAEDDVAVIHGSLDERRFVAVQGRAGEVTGAVGFNSPRELMQLLLRLEAGPLTWDAALAESTTSDT